MKMDITLYKVPPSNEIEAVPHSVEVSDTLYEHMARTDFSKIGSSEDRAISLDDEMIDVRLVTLTPVIRRCIEFALVELLINIVGERIMDGLNLAQEKYKKYCRDENALLQILSSIRDESFTHIGRR
jgi:hypothetical protein